MTSLNMDDLDWQVNGFRVLASMPSGEREAVAVADRGPTVHDRWVTWRVFLRDDGQVIASAGFYTPLLTRAMEDMHDRA